MPSNSPITPFDTTYSNGGNSAFVPNLIEPPLFESDELLESAQAVNVTAIIAAATVMLRIFTNFFI